MVLYWAVMVIVGAAASAFGTTAAIPNNARRNVGTVNVFTGPAFNPSLREIERDPKKGPENFNLFDATLAQRSWRGH
jgi:hypothetical protein